MLSLYRTALRLRREHSGFHTDAFRWLASPAGTLLFERGDGLRCAVNLSGSAMPLPPDRVPLLASVDLQSDVLTPDSAAWFGSGGPSRRARVPLL
jgi:alpha-glucosidase